MVPGTNKAGLNYLREKKFRVTANRAGTLRLHCKYTQGFYKCKVICKENAIFFTCRR